MTMTMTMTMTNTFIDQWSTGFWSTDLSIILRVLRFYWSGDVH